ncbi:hypothetical protein BD309DRAFT_1049364 [Dichomitus squalens]|nr:hypothetical protein BD309DRAFT_1049364 [Dichomitus squalens]
MIAGAPAFAANNHSQSFCKIEALDYTYPKVSMTSPKTSCRSWWYGFPRLDNPVLVAHWHLPPVLDPSDHLGVEPKSFPSGLVRGYPPFTGPAYSTSVEESDRKSVEHPLDRPADTSRNWHYRARRNPCIPRTPRTTASEITSCISSASWI